MAPKGPDIPSTPPAEREQVLSSVRAELVGREHELELILAAVNTGRDLLLEGPPGTSKTTLLRAITKAWAIPLVFVEGNAELTPGRLLGHHDPARVLREGYSEDTFEPGPLVSAMRAGAFLYFEEFNRAPEDTLNTLLGAIADRRVSIPRVGTILAAPTFRLVGSMNPFDNVGTTRLSVSIKDRLNRLVVDYQDADSEGRILDLRCGVDRSSRLGRALAEDAVAVTRMTREHPDVSQGSSVRGAIDLYAMALELCAVRAIEDPGAPAYREAFLETMLMALSGRLLVDHASGREAHEILKAIFRAHFAREGVVLPASPLDLPEGAEPTASADPSDRANRPVKPKPKQLSSEPQLLSGADGAGLAMSGAREGVAAAGRRPAARASFTEESGSLDDEEGEQGAANAAVQALAHEIARNMAVEEAARHARPRRGGEELRSSPYDGGGGEVDLDRTLEQAVQPGALASADVFVRERRRTRRAIALLVDVSGSMCGERLLSVAATVGALSAGLSRDELAVIAFWSDAAVLARFGERPPPPALIDEVLALDAGGLTNVAFPLQLALAELAGSAQRERRALLMSDCLHNAGPDPCNIASSLPRLDVLFHASGERDSDLARDLARAGRGLLAPISGPRDVAPALSRIFSYQG